MSIGMTHSVALQGLAGNLIEIEVDIADGIPSFTLLGLPDAALSESRDRVRAARRARRRRSRVVEVDCRESQAPHRLGCCRTVVERLERRNLEDPQGDAARLPQCVERHRQGEGRRLE